MIKRTEIEDARGNRVHFVRLCLAGEGDQLLDFAESIVSYGETFTRMRP
jgi:hypothetical protein